MPNFGWNQNIYQIKLLINFVYITHIPYFSSTNYKSFNLASPKVQFKDRIIELKPLNLSSELNDTSIFAVSSTKHSFQASLIILGCV